MSLPPLRILSPAPGIFAYYSGRDGSRFAPGPNWVDDGAISLGIASYAIRDGDQALVYDTHVGLPQAQAIRDHLTGLGVTRFTVVLSHWHLDHVAGTGAFADCPVIACERTLAHLARHRTAIEAGTLKGPPAIAPLILPARTYSGRTVLQVGRIAVDLIEADIHSDDATVLWLPDRGLLFSGDTLEDSLTYVSEPEKLSRHRAELARLAALHPRHILPNHGAQAVIAAGGYGPGMIAATDAYLTHLLACRTDPGLRTVPPQQVLARWIASGDVVWFDPYGPIHDQNLARVLDADG